MAGLFFVAVNRDHVLSRLYIRARTSASKAARMMPHHPLVSLEQRIQRGTLKRRPTELGWKVYSLKEKNMRMKLHIEFLKTCMEEDIVPKGLTIDLRSTTGRQDETFQTKLNDILSNCSRQLVECLVEHYERQVAQNVAVIADTFESLEKIEDWTERDKQQVEQEIQSIIDTKEKQLKEQKEHKLETARKKQTTGTRGTTT